MVEGIEVYGVHNLRETYEFLTGEKPLLPMREDLSQFFAAHQLDAELDFAEVRGQPGARRAVEVAVAGGHNLLVIGPPGSGKTTLLLQLRERLLHEGLQPVYLDLMAAASSPDRFVKAALDVLPAEPFSKHLNDAIRIRQLAASGRARAAEAVRALAEKRAPRFTGD